MSIEIYQVQPKFAVRFDGALFKETGFKTHLLEAGIINQTVSDCHILDEERFGEWLVQGLQNGINGVVVEQLDMPYFTFPDNFKSFGETLTKSSTLKKLSIAFESSQNCDRTHLYEAIANNTSLVTLGALLDRMIPREGSNDWQLLAAALKRNKSIKNCLVGEISHLGDHRPSLTLDENAAGDFFSFLKDNNSVTELTINSYLSTNEMGGLVEGLKNNKSVAKMEFGGIFRDPRNHDLSTLNEALKVNKTLTELHLSHVKCTSESLKRLFEGLATNGSLTSLKIVNLTITNGSAAPLFEYLKTTQSLKKIEVLRGISSSEVSSETLEEVLTQNKSITEVKI